MPDTEELRIILRTVADTTGAKQTQQTLRGIQTQAVTLAATGTGVFAALRAIDAYVNFLGDSVTALRDHQREMLGTSAAYATMATEITNLDGAFARAGKSGNDFQLMIGRLAAPAALSGITGIGRALEGVTGLLKDASNLAFDLSQRFPVLFAAAQTIPGIGPSIGQLGAAGQGLAEDQRAIARRRQELAMRRLRELNEAPLAPQDLRLHFWEQVSTAVGMATQAQKAQVALQRESVDLAAQEAQLRLGMLPDMQQMAELQRTVAEQQIKARLAAMPAIEGLEDLRFQQQRAELIARNRMASAAERIGARRELRTIGRAEPGVELRALEAERRQTLVGRVAERAGLETQLFQLSTERQLAQIEAQQATNGWLQQIAGQRTQAIELTINLGTEEFRSEVFKDLVEANNQAQGPTVVKLSGVRR